MTYTASMAKFVTRPCSHCGGTGKELDPRGVGEQMRSLRGKSGKSLRQVAQAIGISAPYLSDLERGNRCFTEELIHLYQGALK